MSTPRSFTSITRDESMKAIEAASEDQTFDAKVVLITEDRYDAVLAFVREHFTKDEPIEKSLGVEWSQEIIDLWFVPAFKLNMSLAMVNPENDEIMAIRTTTVSKRGSNPNLDAIKDGRLRELFRICSIANDKAKFHEHYDCDEAVHYLGLAVNKKYRGRGLATQLVKFHLKFLEHLDISPLYVKAEGSSNYSKRLFEKLGFETLYEFKFDEYIVDGKQVLCNMGEHKSMKNFGYKIR